MSTSKRRGTCYYCRCINIIVTRDHVVPKSRTPLGTDHSENIVDACPWCNNKKHDRDAEEFWVWLNTDVGVNWMIEHYLQVRKDAKVVLPPEAVAAIAARLALTRRQPDGSMPS